MAEAMADTPSNVSNDLYAELRRYFSGEQLIELAATASLENFRARFNRVFAVGSDVTISKRLCVLRSGRRVVQDSNQYLLPSQTSRQIAWAQSENLKRQHGSMGIRDAPWSSAHSGIC
jgi:hypothetical protein